MWPDYMKRDTLAARLDLKPGAVEQYVKRGLLPPPTRLGEADLWYWPEVHKWISRSPDESRQDDEVDPFMEALKDEAPSHGSTSAPRALRSVSR